MSTKKSTTIPQTLHGTRERIHDLRDELELVRHAGLPDAEVEESLRRVLDQSERQFRRVIESAGEAIAGGRYATLAEMFDHQQRAETMALVAVGGAVFNMGTHRFVTLAREHASTLEGPPLRLSSRERRERIEDLQRQIFELETEEERLREAAGEAHRPDCDVLPLLGIPHSVCVDHGLLRGES